MPDDLVSQIPYIERVCEAFCIPILRTDGFEADDVIGTLAQEVAAKDCRPDRLERQGPLSARPRSQIIAMRNNRKT